MRRILAAALVLSSFGLGAAPAGAQTYVPQAVKKSVTLGDLRAIVGSFKDHKVEEEKVFSGESDDISLRAIDETGLKYLLIGTACETNGVSGCQGVMMQVRFDQSKDEVDYKKINAANYAYAAAGTWYDEESATLGVTRYVVLDYGVTMQNLRENLNVLLDLVGDVTEIAVPSNEN